VDGSYNRKWHIAVAPGRRPTDPVTEVKRPAEKAECSIADRRSHNPEDVKAACPKVSILKAGRVVFNIKGNDFRLVSALQYRAGALAIRFFGTHAEYDKIDAETV
jgi:mRNA-degrading endonuclease HigB of HigAB toxin-antitoxin module